MLFVRLFIETIVIARIRPMTHKIVSPRKSPLEEFSQEAFPREEPPAKQTMFYRYKRIIYPLLASFCVAFITHHFFIAFLSYILLGMFFDWSFFTRNGYKDSDQFSEDCFEEIGITGEQVDRRNEFMAMIRWGAFAASICTATTCWMFLTSFSSPLVFFITYIGTTLVSMIVAVNQGKIVSLYRFGRNNGTGYQFSYPGSVIFGPHYNAASDNPAINPFAIGQSHQSACHSSSSSLTDNFVFNPSTLQMDWDPLS
jgi:hypothetical protein